LKLKAGAKMIGSTAPSSGTSSEVFEYGECEVSGKPSCVVNGKTGESKEATIKTEPIENVLEYSSKKGAETEDAEETDTLLKPATGEGFAMLKLGTGCPIESESAVTGEVLAKNLGTPGKSAKAHEIETLEEGTYWNNESGVTTEHKVKKLKVFSEEAGNKGKAKVKTVGEKTWHLVN
jgi:hypothetical protein